MPKASAAESQGVRQESRMGYTHRLASFDVPGSPCGFGEAGGYEILPRGLVIERAALVVFVIVAAPLFQKHQELVVFHGVGVIVGVRQGEGAVMMGSFPYGNRELEEVFEDALHNDLFEHLEILGPHLGVRVIEIMYLGAEPEKPSVSVNGAGGIPTISGGSSLALDIPTRGKAMALKSTKARKKDRRVSFLLGKRPKIRL